MSILIITNKGDITADFIIRKLSQGRFQFFRLNTEDIGNSITVNFNFTDGCFSIKDSVSGKIINLLAVNSVYYRRPEINNQYNHLSTGEQNFVHAELRYTLEGLYKILDNAFWLNKVGAIRNAENKMYQLLLAREIGFCLPVSLVTNNPAVALEFFRASGQQCIIKPIKSGLVEGEQEEGVIFTSKVALDESNVNRISSCPVYLQNLVNKAADIRVTVVGNELFAVKIHSQGSVEAMTDWRRSPVPLPHSVIELPLDIKDKCLQLLKKLDLRYGAIDFILDTIGNYVFLEINPNGQWAWIENRLNLNISDAITRQLATHVLG